MCIYNTGKVCKVYKKQNIFFLGTTTCMYVFKNMKINGNKKKLKSKMKDEKFVCIKFKSKFMVKIPFIEKPYTCSSSTHSKYLRKLQ